MRTLLATTFLLGSMAAMGWFILAQSGRPVGDVATEAFAELQSVAGGSEAAAAPDAASSGPDASAPSGAARFVQYTDERGRIHFVASEADVPARYRESASDFAVDAEIVRPEDAGLPPLASPPRASERRGKAARAFERIALARDEPRRQAVADVTIYTAPWCGWCRRALAWLDDNDVDYVNKDIEANGSNRDELVSLSGGTSIPVVVIDGEIVRGYSPRAMKQLLGI